MDDCSNSGDDRDRLSRHGANHPFQKLGLQFGQISFGRKIVLVNVGQSLGAPFRLHWPFPVKI